MTRYGDTRTRCVRCGRDGQIARRCPHGPLFASCYRTAGRRIGTCHSCRLHRVLPGERDGNWVCAWCADIDGYVCTICAAVDEPMATIGVCERCRIRRRVLAAICEDSEPTGIGRAVVDVLCTRSPNALARWLANSPALIDELRAVASGQRDLSHGNLDRLGGSRRVEHLRQQLIVAGLLPARHHQLALFDRWCRELLTTIDNSGQRQTITAFATWHHRRRLAAAIDNGTLRPASTRAARRHIRAGWNFIVWLDRRGVTLAGCRQADIDLWFSTGNTNRLSATGFITWARTQRLCDRHLDVPVYHPATPTAMPHGERVELVSRLLHDDTIPLGDRVAGLLVALYAQPVTRISRLRLDAIAHTGEHTNLVIGSEHVELAPIVAQLIDGLVADTSRFDSPWLFPGRTPGQPCSSHGLGERLRRHGVSKAARIAAFHDLVQQVPSTVLADLIDYNPAVVAKRAQALAAPWHTYAELRATTPRRDSR